MRATNRGRAPRRSAIVLAAALAVGACGGGDDDAVDTPEGSAPAATDAPPASDGGRDGTTEVTDATEGSEAPGGATTPPEDDPDDGAPQVVTLPPDSVPEPVEGGTLRYALEADVDGLNPTSSQLTAASGLVMAAAVFDKLAELTADGTAVPSLAESFTPSGDFMSWEVRLRPGITFHDGTALDAEAVRINFESQHADPLVGLAVKPFYPVSGAVEVVDELTVRFNLLEPNAQWPAYMASQLGMMASPTWIEAARADPTLNQAPVGTGPFMFESRSEDSVTRFVRNESWWNGRAYLDAIEFLPVPDSATRAELLLNGEVHALHTSEPSAISELRDAEDAGIVTMLDDSGEETFIHINTAVPPFDDIRARQALAYATPRADYVNLIGLGVIRESDQMFIPESPFHNPDVQQVGDDPARAAELAGEYCAERGSETNPVTGQPTCTDGSINMELQWSGPDVVQTRIADLLSQGFSGSFNVTRDELLQDAHILQVVTSGFNVSTWRQFGALNPVTDNVWLMCRTIGGISLNFTRYCDEARDAALLAAQATTDPAERATHYREVVRLMNESYAYVFLTHTMWAWSFDASVHGVCDRTAPDGTELVCGTSGTTWHHTIWLDE